MRFPNPAAAVGAAWLLGACATAGAPAAEAAPAAAPATVPGAPAAASPALPPIPEVNGKLALRVVYPTPEHVIESRDSNFVLGSVGNGHAVLTINGTPVPVAPNGAFLAFLPLPPRETSRYDLVASVGTDTASLAYVVK